MSSKLGKSNISKSESVNTVSSTSTSESMPPPLSRLPKKTRRFVVPSVQVVSIDVRKRRRPVEPIVERFFEKKRRQAASGSIGLSIGLSNLEFDKWFYTQVFFLDEVWEKNKLEQRGTTSENTLALLVEAIEKEEKIKWIFKNIHFIYQQKKHKFKEMQKLQRNEEIANTLSMGSNDELKETILRFLNKCHK